MSSKAWNENFPKALDFNQLIFKIGEVSKMVSVSSRQLRYWGKKGYIKSQRSDLHNSRVYTIYTLMRIANIKNYLDQGYTLTGAVKRVDQHGDNLKKVFSFTRNAFHGMQVNDNETIINLGYFNHFHQKILYAIIKPDQRIEYKLIDVKK